MYSVTLSSPYYGVKYAKHVQWYPYKTHSETLIHVRDKTILFIYM